MNFFCNLRSCTESFSPKQSGFLALIISIFAALIMIVSSYLLKDTQYAENSQEVTWLIMLLWWFPFYALSKRSRVEGKKKK